VTYFFTVKNAPGSKRTEVELLVLKAAVDLKEIQVKENRVGLRKLLWTDADFLSPVHSSSSTAW